ncbi:MAG: hypothetical protein JST49_02925 [Bacteroidetes bacterium]|nr:hypothetical protein [Bacteroidota bacterium]
MGEYKGVFGKNLIETLTLGMYDDPRFIYREYVQNSADQIDVARKENLFAKGERGLISITIDEVNKRITFFDNATGIERKRAQVLLSDIAQSTKDRYTDKGFRGIGRLGGLAYCEKLIFETSYIGEAAKSVMVWDAKQLKRIIEDSHAKVNAAELLSVITEYTRENERPDAHYFKVIMDNVTSEELLDVESVANYLSMVAPVPFAKEFSLSKNIYAQAKKDKVSIDEYDIKLNEEKITKGYKDIFYKTSFDTNGVVTGIEEFDRVIGVEFFKLQSDEGESLCWGWYGITENQHQIPEENGERWIRLRKANIQIGLEDCLNEFFKEAQGNNYYIGEIHATNRYLVPNSRRDFFVESEETTAFKKKLKEFFLNDLHKLYYDFSKKNSALKALSDADKIFSKSKDSISKDEKEKLERRVQKATKDLNSLYKRYEGRALASVIKEKTPAEILDEKKAGYSDQKRSSKQEVIFGPAPDRKTLIEKIYQVIRNNLPKKSAEDLINEIEKIL